MRHRAGIVIYCSSEKKILLIHRKKNNAEYWVAPGGGLEAGENYEQAAGVEKYFISYSDSCKNVTMHGEELKRSTADNIYEPAWVDIARIRHITLLPAELKNRLLEKKF